jgi:hypothetical protein
MSAPNQSWSAVLREDTDAKSLKMELAAFARERGHVPMAYRTIPVQWREGWGEMRGEVEVLCINPKAQVFMPRAI